MNEPVDVAIIGAGPYGLSLAAHLRATPLRLRQFGLPMNLWRTAMPAGMYLKSQGFASNLSDPAGTHTLEAFCRSTGRDYAAYGRPVPLDTFIAYGLWFQRCLAPGLEEVTVHSLTRRANGEFELLLADGDAVRAHNVVVAAGVEHFAYVPPELAGLPPDLCTHSSQHNDLSRFRDRHVTVVGAGQSALETAALLREGNARPQLLARTDHLVWNGEPLDPHRTLLRHLREPESGLGSGWATWFYSNEPRLYHRLPAGVRLRRARTALGPAGACWLRPRVEGRFSVRVGCVITDAQARPDHVVLTVRTPDGSQIRQATEHVIAATGYRPSVDRLSFLDAMLSWHLPTLGGSPRVGRDFASTVPGLFFAGPAVAPSFGPVMRFVYGADFAARVLARRLTGATRYSAGPPLMSQPYGTAR